MRIRIDTAALIPYWLVGDPALNDRIEQSSALSEQIQLTRNQQVVAGADWESVLALDRGNQNIQITATTRREFVSEIERMDFIAALAATDPGKQLHPWSGDVTVRVDSATGSAYKDYSLPSATVALTALTLDGAVSLKLTYRVTSGGFGPRSSSGISGDFFNLTATVPDATFAFALGSVCEAAIQARFTAGDDVVILGNCSEIRNPSPSSRPLQLDNPGVLFFRDAAAYATYLGSSASLYAAVNVGMWVPAAPGSSTLVWRGGSLLGCVGFTLPLSNASRWWGAPAADVGRFSTYLMGEDVLFYDSFRSTTVLHTLRCVTLTRNAYGALVYTIHAPIYTMADTASGEANLTGTTSIGSAYNLTGFAIDE